MNQMQPRLASGNQLLAGLYLAVQIAVPLFAWVTGSPYFGWRMFSEVRVPPRIIVTRAASTDTTSVIDYLGFPRGDLSYSADLGFQICKLVPDAITVRVWPAAGALPSPGADQEIRCK